MRITLILIFVFVYTLYANLVVQDGEKLILNQDENLTIEGTLSINTNAVFEASTNSNINVLNNWDNLGTFIPFSSTVKFYGFDESYISGNNTFYSLISYKDLMFQASTSQEFLNNITLKSEGNSTRSFIHTNKQDIQSIFNLSSHPTININNIEIKDIKNIGITDALMPYNSINLGNTALWFDENIQKECINESSDVTSFSQLSCEEEDSNQINKQTVQYVSSSKIKLKTKVILPKNIMSNIIQSSAQNKTTFIYDSDSASACNTNAIIKLNEDASVTSGFINENNCDNYEDPTLKNFDAIKSDAKIYLLETTLAQQEQHGGAKALIIMDLNLTNPIEIGGK